MCKFVVGNVLLNSITLNCNLENCKERIIILLFLSKTIAHNNLVYILLLSLCTVNMSVTCLCSFRRMIFYSMSIFSFLFFSFVYQVIGTISLRPITFTVAPLGRTKWLLRFRNYLAVEFFPGLSLYQSFVFQENQAQQFIGRETASGSIIKFRQNVLLFI